ncbi:MAG: acetyl-CoA carboxylase biotin carboxyl carrier protein subunit [Bacteroidota bacterium]
MSNYNINIGEQAFSLKKEDLGSLDLVQTATGDYHILQDGKAYKAELESVDFASKTMTIKINGNKYDLQIEDSYDLLVKKMGLSTAGSQKMSNVKAPMPGLVLDILVESDQAVTKGDALLILEAMKMENVLKAEGDGVVKSIEVTKGTAVDKGQVIIEMH